MELGEYRYGFNGQEKSNEIKGDGNSYTAEFWEYDSRMGRRWNLDPKPNISICLYSTFGDNPIFFKDIKGDTVIGNSADMSVYNQYRKDISNRTVKTLLQIGLKESLLELTQDKRQIKKFQRALTDLKTEINELRNIDNELNTLESSTQNYILSSTNNAKSSEGGNTHFAGITVFNGRVYSGAISISFNRAHNALASLSHEFKHAFQFESLYWIENLSHLSTYESYTHSLSNEIEAYKRELFYIGSVDDISSNGAIIKVISSSSIDGAFVLRRGYSEISGTSEKAVVFPAALRMQAAAHNKSVIAAAAADNLPWTAATSLIIYKGWEIDAGIIK